MPDGRYVDILYSTGTFILLSNLTDESVVENDTFSSD